MQVASVINELAADIKQDDSSSLFPVFHFASDHFIWALVQRRLQCFYIMLTYGLLSAWQSFNLHGTVSCVHRQWFLEVFLSPCSDFQDRIVSVFNAELPEGLKVAGILYWFSALSLVKMSLNLTKVLGTVNGGIFKVWGTLLWNCSTISLAFFFSDCWTSAHLYLWETLPL